MSEETTTILNRVTLQDDTLAFVLKKAVAWIEANPGILILDISIISDDCYGAWFAYIYHSTHE